MVQTLQQIMTGKAYDKAVRAHLLLKRSLMHLLLEMVVPVLADGSVVGMTSDITHMHQLSSSDTEHLCCICEAMQTGKVDAEKSDLLTNDTVTTLFYVIDEVKQELCAKSRKAALWIQYLYCIQLLKNFITAERTGDWHLHLCTTTEMLSLFAAAGHQNYAKSARLYVQLMSNLPTSHPWLYEQFLTHGFHTVRRSDR